jgi:hypothetical protein
MWLVWLRLSELAQGFFDFAQGTLDLQNCPILRIFDKVEGLQEASACGFKDELHLVGLV